MLGTVSDISDVFVMLCYKGTFDPSKGISHVGLGNSCMNVAKVLSSNGVNVIVKCLRKEKDLEREIFNNPLVTHVVVAAPWMSIIELQHLSDTFPRVQFAVNTHSNIGFLQAEPAAIRLIRNMIDVEAGTMNFHVAGNSTRFCEAMMRSYGAPITYLPNLYYVDNTSGQPRPNWSSRGGVLKVGMFGAPRVQKNFISGAQATIIATRDLKAQVELHVNSGRNDGGEMGRIWQGILAATAGVPGLTVVNQPWAPWPQFRGIIESMDVCLQPSSSESFNLVTADAASRYVPSLCTSAIDWTPDEWKAPVDDVSAMARTIVSLVYDPQAPQRGFEALMAHNEKGLNAWLRYLLNKQFGVAGRPWAERNMPATLKRQAHSLRHRMVA